MFAVFFEEIIFLLLSLFFVFVFYSLTTNKITTNKIYKLKKKCVQILFVFFLFKSGELLRFEHIVIDLVG